MKRRLSALMILCSSALLLSGCGGSVSLNITCSQFSGKSGNDQRKITVAYLKQIVGDEHPGTLSTIAAESGLEAFCHSNPTTELNEIKL